MKEINRERFEAWLFSQPGNRIIEAGSIDACFICCFIKETSSLKPILGWDTWGWLGSEQSLKLPDWVRQLIDREWLLSLAEPENNDFAISVAQMQERYLALFPDALKLPEVKTETAKV